jgi:hypothetical protein
MPRLQQRYVFHWGQWELDYMGLRELQGKLDVSEDGLNGKNHVIFGIGNPVCFVEPKEATDHQTEFQTEVCCGGTSEICMEAANNTEG